MNSIEIAISAKVASVSFEFSKHAVDQMMQRGIFVHEVKESALKNILTNFRGM